MRHIPFLIPFLLFATTVFSQKNDIYKGVVKDAISQENIPYATVAAYDNSDLIDGISTDNNGEFELKIKKKITHLEISFMGYQTYILPIPQIQNKEQIKINLLTANTTLDEVVIQAERTTTQLKIDRKIVNLGADLQQSGVTALEAFDQISEIQADLGTGTISLRGSGNVRLLINGKPSAMNTTEVLDQIPASLIDHVEVITSPSAKNQADGISGIINVILKRNMNTGLNLTLNSSVGTKRHSIGFNTNYNLSAINIKLNASRSRRNMDSKQWIYQRYANGNTRDFFAPHDFNGKIITFSSGIDYFINTKNELSFEVNHTNDFHSFYNNTFYTNTTGRNDYVYTRNSSHEHKTTVYNLNYRKKFDTDEHFLEAEYNASQNKNVLPAIDFEENVFLFNELQQNNNDLHALAIDYTLPTKHALIETGGSWNRRILTSFRFFEPSSNMGTQDRFDYQEDLIGMYGLAKFSTEKLDWQTGLRYEYFVSNSDNTANNETTDLKFSNLFPSLHLSYKPNKKNTFSTGYSKRISRPNFHHINPFQIGNQYFQWKANPNLKPEFSDNFELNYHHDGNKFNASLTTFYRNRNDVIQWIETIDDDGVRFIAFDNVGSRNSYGIESTIQYKTSNFWNTEVSANYYHTIANQPNITWNTLYSSNIILKNTFKIFKNFSTDITYQHTPENQNIYSITQPRNRIDWAVRAKFLNNKITANLRVVDVLDRNLRKRTTVLPNIIENEIWRFQSQTLGWLFSLNYKLFQNKGKVRNRKKRNFEHGGSTD